MKVKITKVPASGKSTTIEIKIDATGVALSEVLKQAGIDDPSKMNVTVNGEMATAKTHVPADAEVAVVTVTEKARGS